MSDQRIFDSGVSDSVAVLPDAPSQWSYSSLKAIETCPRRYVLSRAKYPNLWSGSGYPEVPNPAALFGDVVHDSLEKIIRALVNSGCTSASGPEAIAVLRELGGYSRVAKEMLANRLAKLDENPRLAGNRWVRLQDQLEHRIPEAREEVQHYLHRVTLTPKEGTESGSGGGEARYARCIGSHPEAELRADELRIWGRIDLLTVTLEGVDITDHKTGAENESHLDQLRFYAVLWDQDDISNVSRTPLRTLTASYPNHEVAIEAPDAAELQALVDGVGPRVAAADAMAVSVVPAAQVGEHCGFCSVRTLCSTYWQFRPDPAGLKDGDFFDFEGVVADQNGIKSWWLQGVGGYRRLLLRTSSAHQEFESGQRLRLLGLVRDEDPETDAVVAVLTQNSEVFVVTGESDY